MMTPLSASKPFPRSRRWLERCIAILAVINLVLVFFDLTYIPMRDVYLRQWPTLVQWYDPVKGITPHPETQYYLNQVDQFARIAETEITSDLAVAQLAELRRLSQQMVTDSPFEAVGKGEVLAKLERTLSDRVGTPLGRDGLNQFWSVDYLVEAGWQQELAFFNAELRPLIASNYYRDITLYGRWVDYFWLIDLPFVAIFAVDILVRTFQISRRCPDLSWLEAILRRWYDLPLILPFWRWLRVIPVVNRLYQTNLLNLNLIKAQLNHDFAVHFAGELVELTGIQVIDQMQATIRSGALARWLLEPESRRPYIQVNPTNEVTAIAQRLVTISVYDVWPQVQPDVEALVHHSLNHALNQSPAYQQLQAIPGLKHLPEQLIERLARDLSKAVHGSLVTVIEDPVGTELSARLSRNFQNALLEELQRKPNLQQFEDWLVDLLEEIKINYVKNIVQDDMERVVEEAEKLRRMAR